MLLPDSPRGREVLIDSPETGYWLCFLKKMEGMQTDRAIRQRERAEPANLEDVDFVSLDGVEVVVHGQEDQEGSKHGDGGQEMPNVVVVKER